MRAAGARHREADRGAVYLDVGERQSGHSLRRNIHFRGPFVAVAMQVEDEGQLSGGRFERAFPSSSGIGGRQHGCRRQQQ